MIILIDFFPQRICEYAQKFYKSLNNQDQNNDYYRYTLKNLKFE